MGDSHERGNSGRHKTRRILNISPGLPAHAHFSQVFAPYKICSFDIEASLRAPNLSPRLHRRQKMISEATFR